MIRILLCLDSSMVEHAAVNRGVAGSSPARGGLSGREFFLPLFQQEPFIGKYFTF